MLFFPEASLIGGAVVASWSEGASSPRQESGFPSNISLMRCHNTLCHNGRASATQRHGCTDPSVVSLRACLNNNPPPLCHFRQQHLLGSWRNDCISPLFPSTLSLHFIANICHCPPLCCRSTPFGDPTGASTVPASCGD